MNLSLAAQRRKNVASRRVAKESFAAPQLIEVVANHGLRGSCRTFEAKAFSLREKVAEGRMRAFERHAFPLTRPHPAFGHPLPRGEGSRLNSQMVDTAPEARHYAAPRLSFPRPKCDDRIDPDRAARRNVGGDESNNTEDQGHTDKRDWIARSNAV
jgi:hypothetical protein